MRRVPVLLWPTVLAVAVASCGLKPASQFSPDVEPGSIERTAALEGVEISVTSKEFTEQLVLGKIAVLALKAAGADVSDKTNVQGSNSARRSVERGDADLMWEYTGTGWVTYLGQTESIPDAVQQFEAVREMDLRENQIDWIALSPLNDTFALAVTEQSAQKYDLASIGDLANVPPDERTFCLGTEFFSREDGFTGMLEAYGMSYPADAPDSNITKMADGVVYDSTANGTCVFGSVFSTDGRIQALNLVVLEDDKRFFPFFNAAISVREEVLEQYPELVGIFEQISALLDDETITSLNAKVDVDGEDPAFVARDWMRDVGLVN